MSRQEIDDTRLAHSQMMWRMPVKMNSLKVALLGAAILLKLFVSVVDDLITRVSKGATTLFVPRARSPRTRRWHTSIARARRRVVQGISRVG
jgi:hypothetical protein